MANGCPSQPPRRRPTPGPPQQISLRAMLRCFGPAHGSAAQAAEAAVTGLTMGNERQCDAESLRRIVHIAASAY